MSPRITRVQPTRLRDAHNLAPRLFVALAVAVLVLLGLVTGLLVDWDWFVSLGFGNVFWTVLVAKVAVFFAVFVASAIVPATKVPWPLRSFGKALWAMKS